MRRLALILILTPSSWMPAQTNWVGTWAAAPLRSEQAHVEKVGIGETDKTIREIVHVSQGGKSVRLSLTNEFGILPLELRSVHVALQTAKGAIEPATDRAVTFPSGASVTLAPGGSVTSNPIDLSLLQGGNLAVSIFVPKQKIDGLTFHGTAVSTTYFASGDHVRDASIPDADVSHSWYFLKNVQVSAELGLYSVVTIGDSITDGSFSQFDMNYRWPDELATRLMRNEKTTNLSVMNVGIGGNRLLHDYIGQRASDRFERDVLSAPGVKYVVLLEGINDIGFTDKPRGEGDAVTTEQLIAAMQQLIDRAHAHGLKIFGGTLTPFIGARYATQEGEQMRLAMNRFIRTPHHFDGVIDFDKAVQDPAHPDRLLPAFDHGDHLHPSDDGYIAMGDAVDLSLFSENKAVPLK
ncbi:MAG TPA: SGNH/GDSL hydrolase family protein [Edaphobacter sp.]|nr:SGNH/GDSL hydrolase family protein [Edaphobacter sp.]